MIDIVCNNIFNLPCLCLVVIYTCITLYYKYIHSMCILTQGRLTLYSFCLYLTWYQSLRFFGIFFVAHATTIKSFNRLKAIIYTIHLKSQVSYNNKQCRCYQF